MTNNNRTDQVLEALSAGIAQLTSSERWTEWLAVQSRFYHYSFRNTLLIELQCPHATRVAGYRAWQALGRQVRKGEKSIAILAPVTRKVADADHEQVDDKTRVLVGFRPASVFDISQTDGEPLPEPCTRLQGDDPQNSYELLLGVAASIGYSVEDADLDGTTNGDCTYALRRIRVAADRSPAQRVKTLAHELAHALLHEGHSNRPLAELEAESVAYVVCRNLGIPSDEYTFGYVATWAGGGDEAIAALKASAGRIQQTADKILGVAINTEESSELEEAS